jgi:hypothetical protein
MWSQKKRAGARLGRELASLEIHAKQLEANCQSQPWYVEANAQLAKARCYLNEGDFEGGWYCFHAGRRLLMHALTKEEIVAEAIELKMQAERISSTWRRECIAELLKEPSAATHELLIQACEVRDRHDANTYHRIWLASDQMTILCAVAAFSTICALASLILLPDPNSGFDARSLISVALFGIMGASFSVGQTIIKMTGPTRIPEYVANHWTTLMRVALGAVSGLAGEVFLASNIVHLNVGAGENSLAVGLTAAFLFGYAGEKLIKKIAGSVGPSETTDAK